MQLSNENNAKPFRLTSINRVILFFLYVCIFREQSHEKKQFTFHGDLNHPSKSKLLVAFLIKYFVVR